MTGGDRLRCLFKGIVGNGERILFWLDPWLKDSPLREVYPNLFALEMVKTCCVSDRIHGIWMWKHDPDCPAEVIELNALLSDLSSITLNSGPDSWKWLADRSGLFSVCSVRRFIDSRAVDSNNIFILDWCKWIPFKCDVFVWRAEMGRIPTTDALRKRGINVGEELCPLCRSEEESSDHLFTSCMISAVLWQKVSSWCRVPPIFAFSVRDLLVLHKSGPLKAKERLVFQGIIRVACWCLWLARNNARFLGKEVKVEAIFSEVRFLGFLWFKHRIRNNPISWSDWCKYVIS
ncbi:putative reverse transcriptase zinc-binding domain-containing protein [Helianthus annuus]|nr:putative reverse transcriptase zinc-binding domain-containing protein [Helianthus annuus]